MIKLNKFNNKLFNNKISFNNIFNNNRNNKVIIIQNHS